MPRLNTTFLSPVWAASRPQLLPVPQKGGTSRTYSLLHPFLCACVCFLLFLIGMDLPPIPTEAKLE